MSGWLSLSTKKGGWGAGWLNGFSPLRWFAAGEQGAWYDPSDLTTLFQDSAGTTPVTAVEQPVGLMKDKSGRNNHASQATAGNRPILSARVNLLLATENFSNAAWVKSSVSATVNTITCGSVNGFCTQTTQTSISVNSSATIRIKVNPSLSTAPYLFIAISDFAVNGFGVCVNLSTFVITNTVSGGGTISYASVSTADSNGFYTVSLTGLSSAYVAATRIDIRPVSTTGLIGVVGQTIVVKEASVMYTNAGARLPAYQRVNTSTDYDTAGFPLYLACNGTSSAMSTSSIDFTATDKMTVVTGLRKLSNAAIGTALELSATSASNNGSFTLTAPNSAAANYAWLSKGTTADTLIATTYAAPINNVLTGLGNISGATNSIRVNGIATSDTNTQGTGNYGNYPLYLFARAGTSLFFNGQFYGAIIRGAQSDTASVTQTENYMATKTGITF